MGLISIFYKDQSLSFLMGVLIAVTLTIGVNITPLVAIGMINVHTSFRNDRDVC